MEYGVLAPGFLKTKEWGSRMCQCVGWQKAATSQLRGARTVRDWRGITRRTQEGARLSSGSLSFLTCQMGPLTVLISVD